MNNAREQGSRLILMRHAKAEPYSGGRDDFLRVLTPRGRADAERMGRWLAATDCQPVSCLSSPAKRTRETVELVCRGLGRASLSDACSYDDSLYHSSIEHLCDALVAHDEASDVLVVGHNPGLEDFLEWLLPRRTEVDIRFPTAGISVLACTRPLSELERGCARILHQQRPKAL